MRKGKPEGAFTFQRESGMIVEEYGRRRAKPYIANRNEEFRLLLRE